MEQITYIRLGNRPQEGVEWFSRESGSAPVKRSGTLDELRTALPAGARPVVFAPACTMATIHARVPPLKGARLRQALPYAMEEHVAGDVESLHFAMGTPKGSGELPVVAVAKDTMTQWLERLNSVGVRPGELLNEALSLPWREGQWSLLLEDQSALLRTDRYRGLCFPASQLSAILELAAAKLEGDSLERVQVYDARRGDREPLTAVEALPATSVDYEPCDDPLQLMMRGVDRDGINLLQGAFSISTKQGGQWKIWRLTAGLAATLLVLQLANLGYRYYSLQVLDDELYQQTETIFRETFPQVRNVVNPQVQMERRLEALRGGGSSQAFTRLIAIGGKAVVAGEGITITRMRYREGELELELELASLQALDSLKARLQQSGAAVDVKNATAREQKVVARIALREAAA